MYIFSRTRSIEPSHVTDALAGAPTFARTFEEVAGVRITPWYQAFAPTGQAMTFTMRLDSLGDFDKIFGQVVGSAEYQAALAEVEPWFSGPNIDNITQLVAGSPPQEPSPIVSVVQASASNGHLRAAMHWGADLSERFGRTLDVPTVFGRGLFGQYGSLMWANYHQDMDAMEAVDAKFGTDEMLQAVVDEGAHNCRPDAVHVVMRRLS